MATEEKMTGADVVLKVLEEEDVEVIFGIPGGSTIPVFDRLYHKTEAGELRFVLTRHEQGAAHAADGYARATGRVGVCTATSGPGALNLVTGLCTAHMDSIPVVAITGQVKTHAIGTDAFQEADTVGATMPITKHNYLVKDPAELAHVVREAFYLARSGRPGAVLIDLPSDVSAAPGVWTERDMSNMRGYTPPEKGDPQSIARAAEMISQAERPILYIGGGVIAAGASDLVRELAEKTNIYVVHTLMGKGAFPETHRLSLGMPGMHGVVPACYALRDADLMITIGARFDDRVTGDLSKFAQGAKIIHIDIDPAEHNKVVPANVAIAGDAREVLAQLVPQVQARQPGQWEKQLEQWREKHPLRYNEPDEGIAPQYVVEQIYEATGGEAIITTEVGQNQMWAAQYYKVDKPRHFLSSGGLGTMGYGFPAAIGAQVGCPDAVVWDSAGDGSIQMNIQELATAVINKLPVKVAILNNSYLGMVRQWQELFYDRRYSGTDLTGNPDFARVAEAYGGVGIKVAEPEQVRPAIEQAMEVDDRPTFIDFVVAKEENVFPMIPAGKTPDDIMLSQPS